MRRNGTSSCRRRGFTWRQKLLEALAKGEVDEVMATAEVVWNSAHIPSRNFCIYQWHLLATIKLTPDATLWTRANDRTPQLKG